MSMPLHLDADNALNAGVLRWLQERNRRARPLVRPGDHPDPYYGAGCHPDIVECLWERVAKRIPDARCLIYGTPALAQPASGVILAVGMGTQYCVRVLPEALAEALAHSCTPTHRWSGSETVTDLALEFGDGWVFGGFSAPVSTWVEAAYARFNTPPAAGARLLTL